ncbi:C4-dicarboxylic acid transporter DauA [Modicisalibacter coralii]|uniref:C4-dicarboxylic acid transporter DauA n=1 Tax=Modicisalibacter coralii TaxID=2304602 RepID=UPI00100BF6A6|nr:C4-dicarboxylic acid transporter DauA [Halomonas coralii]
MSDGERRWTGPRLATGLREAWREGYGVRELRSDLLAGLTIGIVAVPLSMALAIATGVAPQHGLYTAIVAGIVIALTGGARFNVSGPTAAFVVILFPIVQQYGLGGLLLASLMAGLILVGLGAARLGALIQFVPYPVVLGFTAGIAVVIATLQIPDFLGLTVELGDSYIANLGHIVAALPSVQPQELSVGVLTLAVLLVWPRLKTPVPAPLAGLVAGALAALVIDHWLPGQVATIDSRFHWSLDGTSGQGIPPIAPRFDLPWNAPGPDGQPLGLSFELLRQLLGPAFAIAMLAAIESLLCAVVADGMTRGRHDPNAELIGQGLGNLCAPFFGGITATGALARTATNIRSGARSPLSAVVHSLVVLLAVIGLAGLLGRVPMASLAALLFIIAWNMSEAHLFLRTLRTAPAGDIAILALCFVLTVVFDMVLAVGVGIGMAAALFIHRMSALSRTARLDSDRQPQLGDLPPSVAAYSIAGPMFFGVADKALAALHITDPQVRIVLIDMRQVPSIDGTALVALRSLVDEMRRREVGLIFVGLTPRQIVKLKRTGIHSVRRRLNHCADFDRARRLAHRWLNDAGEAPTTSGPGTGAE